MPLVHLTDAQSTGQRFRGKGLKARYGWGGVPRLAHAGEATLRLIHRDAWKYNVWRLDLSGKRVAEVPMAVKDSALGFSVTSAGPSDATLCYKFAGNSGPVPDDLPAFLQGEAH